MTDEEFEAKRMEIRALLQRIIEAVARENHQGVCVDDHLMVLPTISKVIADDAADAHMKMLRQHAKEHEAAALRWRMDAKESGQKILDVALDAVRKQIALSTADAVKRMRETIREEMETAIAGIRAENESGRKSHGPMVMAGGIMAFLGGLAALASVVLR